MVTNIESVNKAIEKNLDCIVKEKCDELYFFSFNSVQQGIK